MHVRILEVTRVSTPERIVSRLDDNGSCLLCLLHHDVDFGFRGNVVADAEFGRTSTADVESGIVSQARSWPERELQTGLQVEESDCPVLELRADNALGP
jgi:hypothetical protein